MTFIADGVLDHDRRLVIKYVGRINLISPSAATDNSTFCNSAANLSDRRPLHRHSGCKGGTAATGSFAKQPD